MEQHPDLESPLKIAPTPKKQKAYFNVNKCVFCQKMDREPLRTSPAGVDNIIKICTRKKDIVFDRLVEKCAKGDIEQWKSVSARDVNIKYHKLCYALYAKELAHLQSPSSPAVPHSSGSAAATPVTARRALPLEELFDWTRCMFCQQLKVRGEYELISLDLTGDRLKAMKEAIQDKGDERLVNASASKQWDLKGAKYHKTCKKSFLRQKVTDKKPKSIYDSAFEDLIKKVEEDLMIKKRVFSMDLLLKLFRDSLPENESDSYSVRQLGQRLSNYYGNAIVLDKVDEQGVSDLVYSSAITVSEAIKTVRSLKADLKQSRLKEFTAKQKADHEGKDKFSVLHAAASILRQEITSYECMAGGIYPSAEDMTLSAALEKIPNGLLCFILWIFDKNA